MCQLSKKCLLDSRRHVLHCTHMGYPQTAGCNMGSHQLSVFWLQAGDYPAARYWFLNSAAQHCFSELRGPVNTNLIAALTEWNNCINSTAKKTKQKGKGRIMCSGPTLYIHNGISLYTEHCLSLFCILVDTQRDNEAVDIMTFEIYRNFRTIWRIWI